MKRILACLWCLTVVFGGACSAGSGRTVSGDPPPTPTPNPLARLNPNIVEDTDTYFVERLPKNEMIRVDDRHIRHPLVGPPVEFFKEDENYYYVLQNKPVAGMPSTEAEVVATPSLPSTEATPGPLGEPISPADFADLNPPAASARLRFQEVQNTGLPTGGMWRASFVATDFNRDGKMDIVSPPPRIGGGLPRIWLGNGNGRFAEWPLTFSEGGKTATDFSVAYGGVAVGDIDQDGALDIATASHGAGLVTLFGNGSGQFEIVRKGLPGRDFSSQAVALLDADNDGRLDLVASRDVVTSEEGQSVDMNQVRLYLFRGREKGWVFEPEGIVGGVFSNSLQAWDYQGDRKTDVLGGSHYVGALSLLWENLGDARFSRVEVPNLERFSYHSAVATGTLGSVRTSAFAAVYNMFASAPTPMQAVGITVYSFRNGSWSRHRVWRKQNGNALPYALAMGDLDGDGLDDIVFPDSEERRLRAFLQKPDASFVELARVAQPILDSPGQCVRLADLNGDGRLDVVLAKTVSSASPDDPGGWSVYLSAR